MLSPSWGSCLSSNAQPSIGAVKASPCHPSQNLIIVPCPFKSCTSLHPVLVSFHLSRGREIVSLDRTVTRRQAEFFIWLLQQVYARTMVFSLCQMHVRHWAWLWMRPEHTKKMSLLSSWVTVCGKFITCCFCFRDLHMRRQLRKLRSLCRAQELDCCPRSLPLPLLSGSLDLCSSFGV